MPIQVDHDALFSILQWLEPIDIENMMRASRLAEPDDTEADKRIEISSRDLLKAVGQYYNGVEKRLKKSRHITAWKVRLIGKATDSKGVIPYENPRMRVVRLAIGVALSFERRRAFAEILVLLYRGKDADLEQLNRDLCAALPPPPAARAPRPRSRTSQETLSLPF